MLVTRGPFGLDAKRGATFEYQRTVLAVVHTITSATRLGDVVPMLERDPRIQVVYTHPPTALLSGGTEEFLTRLDGISLPWALATQHLFNLVVTAHSGLLEWVHGPVAYMPHGAGFSKYETRWNMEGPKATREVVGPDRARLVHHGRVIASAHLLPTHAQAKQLARSCPEASGVTFVTGDPCYDRLEASLPSRAAYREALATGDRMLVTVTSSWGPGSLLSMRPGLVGELVKELPRELYQVAMIVHPNATAWHGHRQVKAWYSDCIRDGLLLIPPVEGWRATIAASDVVIGDHGSVSCYAAAAGIPVLLGTYPAAEVEPGSLVARLADVAPHIRPGTTYAPQLEAALAAWNPGRHSLIRTLVTDLPGRAAPEIRRHLYRLMDLPEPRHLPRPELVPAPVPVTLPQTFGGNW